MEREDFDDEIVEQLESFYNTPHTDPLDFLSHAEQVHNKIQEIKNRSLSEKINKSANAEMSKE